MRPSDTHLVTLVGCGKAKRPGRHAAGELYTGHVTRRRLAAATAREGSTFIVSARHGLLALDDEVESYDNCLDVFTEAQATRWARIVAYQLADYLLGRDAFGADVEILASETYARPLRAALLAMGVAARVA